MIVTNSLTGGGAERSMNLVSNELTKRGWPVALVPINFSEPDLVDLACEVFPLNRQWRGGIFNTLSAIKKFNQVVHSWKPDLLVLNCDLPELFGALLLSNRRMVAVEHINRPWITRLTFGRMVRGFLRIRRVTWVAVSSHLTIWPEGISPNAILLNSLTPISVTMPTKNQTDKNPKLTRIVFIGRLTPQKRPEWILEIVSKSGLNAEIFGDGLLKNALQSQAAEHKQNIIFSGFVRDPWSHLGLGDLLIVPSEWEGDGLVVIEALKVNIPILVADIPDFRRFGLPDKNYCKNIDDFVGRINQYRDDLYSLVVAEEITDSILASRSLEVVGDAWEKFLNSA
ncbi:unannotated protein [freshwater metagenome]|uniref:Unannotated protein n=1 Tax=freshwater metagenome TaxID=449393 RepID=A0A6J6ZMC4_9ZZZZ